jgi:predicted GH43/DUF377 family glycosyl hydrolase
VPDIAPLVKAAGAGLEIFADASLPANDIWIQDATEIGYATSNDGLAWTKYPSPVLSPGPTGTWDSGPISVGSVAWNGTFFLMWYTGSSPVTYSNGAFGLATSNDGITWTKYSHSPVMTPSAIDQYYTSAPDVIKMNLTYNMWYTGRSGSDPQSSPITRILYATSFDGIIWNKWPSSVFAPSSDPCVGA